MRAHLGRLVDRAGAGAAASCGRSARRPRRWPPAGPCARRPTSSWPRSWCRTPPARNPGSSSHLQWAMKRPRSGDRSRLKGVTTGERTPLIRAAAMILISPGEWRACSATKRRRRPVTNYQPAAHRFKTVVAAFHGSVTTLRRLAGFWRPCLHHMSAAGNGGRLARPRLSRSMRSDFSRSRGWDMQGSCRKYRCTHA